MKTIFYLTLSMFVFFVSASAQAAGDAAAGKSKAALCSACHGPEGISSTDIWPNLKGQKYGYLVKQIKAFRDGSRKDPSMQPMVANLSDDDIKNVAAYYSTMK
jgi:cytochrome c553